MPTATYSLQDGPNPDSTLSEVLPYLLCHVSSPINYLPPVPYEFFNTLITLSLKNCQSCNYSKGSNNSINNINNIWLLELNLRRASLVSPPAN